MGEVSRPERPRTFQDAAANYKKAEEEPGRAAREINAEAAATPC